MPHGQLHSSGFSGADADIYKLEETVFESHLSAIASGADVKWLQSETDVLERTDVILTFDDGGIGAWPGTARLLESRGWRGHFFIPTSRIGTPGFLDRSGIKALHDAGHIVGSHSHSHPGRITKCTKNELEIEWERSAEILEAIIGTRPFSASVPAGFYDRRVGEAVAKAGFGILFTSEPVREERRIAECRIVGRFSIQAGTPATVVGGLAKGDFRPRANQWALWNAKKVAKRLGGEGWLAFRKRWFAR